MTLFQIAALYIALNMLLNPVLMYRVGKVRMKEKISLGDGDNPAMLSRIRAHGNFSETAPLALIGLIGLAMLGAHPLVMHLFGAAFLIGRLLHAHGMAQKHSNGKGRFYGMIMTIFTYIGTALTLLFLIFTFNGS